MKVHKRQASNTLQVFASYIGLALHHAKLYDKIKKNEQKYKVVQEVVNYQSTARSTRGETIQETLLFPVIINQHYNWVKPKTYYHCSDNG